MTIDERLDRIPHIMAGMFEQTRKDREEDRQLWRDTQRQLNDLAARTTEFAQEFRAADRQLAQRISSLAEESRAADQRLGERIESLVSAIGKLASEIPPRDELRAIIREEIQRAK